MLYLRKTLFISALAVALAACSGNPNTTSSSTSPTTSSTETSPSTASSSPTETSPSPSTTSSSPAGTTGSPAANTPASEHKVFAQQIQVPNPPKSGKVDSTIKLPVTVKNTSNFVWNNVGANLVDLSYNWYDSRGTRVVFNGERTPLPQSLAPLHSEKLNAVIKFPNKPGKYNLVLTMVQEGVTWFNDAGAQAPKFPVTVTAK